MIRQLKIENILIYLRLLLWRLYQSRVWGFAWIGRGLCWIPFSPSARGKWLALTGKKHQRRRWARKGCCGEAKRLSWDASPPVAGRNPSVIWEKLPFLCLWREGFLQWCVVSFSLCEVLTPKFNTFRKSNKKKSVNQIIRNQIEMRFEFYGR